MSDLWIKGDGLYAVFTKMHMLFQKKTLEQNTAIKTKIESSAPNLQSLTDAEGLDSLQIFCDYFNLPVTSGLIRSNLTLYNGNHESMPAHILMVIMQAFREEISQKQFLMIGNTDYWTRIPLEGRAEAVMLSHPECMFDLTEAYKCFSVRRYTACVFHLMRATEILVKALSRAEDIQATVVSGNGECLPWGKMANNIKDKVDKLNRGEKKDNWSGVVTQLLGLNRAYRTKTAHPERTYTEQEAVNIITLTEGMFDRCFDVLDISEEFLRQPS